jgi:hypothetical protein
MLVHNDPNNAVGCHNFGHYSHREMVKKMRQFEFINYSSSFIRLLYPYASSYFTIYPSISSLFTLLAANNLTFLPHYTHLNGSIILI